MRRITNERTRIYHHRDGGNRDYLYHNGRARLVEGEKRMLKNSAFIATLASLITATYMAHNGDMVFSTITLVCTLGFLAITIFAEGE